MKLAISHLLL